MYLNVLRKTLTLAFAENYNNSLASKPIHTNSKQFSSSARRLRLLLARLCTDNDSRRLSGWARENHNNWLASRPIHTNSEQCSSSARRVRLPLAQLSTDNDNRRLSTSPVSHAC